uniref:Fibrinogen C-terminal domain-containing protein n=1 Tax=Pyxicephalus adspersus TaxID=30357 RepID=A0AAV3A436_PYXAD|nr:TPA: hypothetical protein GDO54_017870 [Pyxicephalus adspersus]
MHTDGGGWLVFQRRVDGSVNFYQDWKAYKTGFGSQLNEFWLGNDNIHQLTATGSYELQIDLQDFDYNNTYATYNNVKVEGEKDLYGLRFSTFTGGSAGDSLNIHKNRAFTTKDKDNDRADKNNCAVLYYGAWWHSSCHDSNLNGLYRGSQHKKGHWCYLEFLPKK